MPSGSRWSSSKAGAQAGLWAGWRGQSTRPLRTPPHLPEAGLEGVTRFSGPTAGSQAAFPHETVKPPLGEGGHKSVRERCVGLGGCAHGRTLATAREKRSPPPERSRGPAQGPPMDDPFVPRQQREGNAPHSVPPDEASLTYAEHLHPCPTTPLGSALSSGTVCPVR